jgi:hypothetical protein
MSIADTRVSADELSFDLQVNAVKMAGSEHPFTDVEFHSFTSGTDTASHAGCFSFHIMASRSRIERD